MRLFITVVIAIIFLCPLTACGKKLQDEWKVLDDGVKVPVPPAEHPRLYLRAEHIEDLRRRIEHPVLKPTWENLQRLATMNAHYSMAVDALRYLLDGDRKTGRRAVDTALDTLEAAEWERKQDYSRDIGRLMWAAAVVYDWCYDLLTQEEKEKLVSGFIGMAEQFSIGYPIRSEGLLTGHVGEWMVMRDMLSAGIAIYDEYPEMYNQAAGLFFRELLPGRNWFYPGHAYHQGVAYGDTRFGSELYPLWIYDRLGFGNVYHRSQQFVPYHWIYMRRPDGRMMTSGDDFIWTPKLSSLLCASYYKDGYILADYLKDEWPFEYLKHATHPMDQMYVLLWRDPDLQPADISELPLTRFMDSPYGWMVARTGWDDNSVIAEMKVNEYNFLNHQHLDAGTFQVYYKGPLAVDSGIYEGDDGGYLGPHNINYYKRTIAHNSLLVYDPNEDFTTTWYPRVGLRPRSLPGITNWVSCLILRPYTGTGTTAHSGTCSSTGHVIHSKSKTGLTTRCISPRFAHCVPAMKPSNNTSQGQASRSELDRRRVGARKPDHDERTPHRQYLIVESSRNPYTAGRFQ